MGGGDMSANVRLCPVLFGFYETTDVFFGTLADIDGLERTLTDKHYEIFSHKIWTKCFRLIMIMGHGSMKHEQKSFPESFSIRSSEGRAPASELVLRRGSLHIEIALQKGIPRVQNRISKGRSGLRKPKKIFDFSVRLFFKLIRNLNKKVGPFRLLAPILLGGGGGGL